MVNHLAWMLVPVQQANRREESLNITGLPLAGQLAIFKAFPRLYCVRACLQGGRVTLASGLTLAGGQMIARVTLQPGTT